MADKSYARVMVHDVNDEHDYIVLCRHYNGSGALVNLTEIYVVREQKFLGRFNVTTFAWEPSAEHKRPATEADIKAFSNHAKAMAAMAEKLWK